MNKLSKKDLRILILPLAAIGLVIILIAVTGNFAYSQYKNKVAEIENLTSTKNILNTKATELEQKKTALSSLVSSALLAVPDENPSLMIYNHLKRISLANGIVFLNLRASSTIPEDETENLMYSATFKTTSATELPDALLFLDDMNRISPLVLFTGLSMNNEDNEESQMQIDFTGYYASLPENLSNIDEPLDLLTQSDIDALNNAASLIRPSFTSIGASQTTKRENPFNF